MVATTLEEIPTLGSTMPRVFTPPHPDNCDPGFQGHQCECGCGLNELTSFGWSAIFFLERFWGWTLLPWQRWLYWHALEKRPATRTGFRFPTVVVLVGRQQGKLLDLDTEMLTPQGFVRLGDIEDGNEVFHPDGHTVTVVKAHPVEQNPMSYRVETTDGRAVTAGADHLWTVQDRRRRKRKGRRGEKPVTTCQWETLTTEDLLARGLLRSDRVRANGSPHQEFAFRLPRQKPIISKPVNLPVDPYLFGVWLGDGDSHDANITIGRDDLEEMTEHLSAVTRIVSVRPDRKNFRVRVSIDAPVRDGFQARIKRLGVYRDKHIPDPYLTAGTEQRQALLAGLLDTDGHCTDGQVEFCSSRAALAHGVLYLARSLGYRAVLTKGRATLDGADHGEKYRVRFTPSDHPFRLTRKNARVRPCAGDRTAVSIRSITPVDSRPMRCITVDSPDGLYLAGRDLIPTHNTRWIKGLGLWRLFMNEYGVPNKYCPAARLAVIAAQNLDYAENMLAEVVDEIRDHPTFCRELINHRVTNGRHRAILSNRRFWRAATASRKGARSLTVDLAMLDELREHTTADAYNAIAPTTTVRPYSQVVCTSNAGDARSIVLASLREAATRRILDENTLDTQVGLWEWSVPMEVNPRDPKYWYLSLPAMGRLNDFTIDTVMGKYESMQYKNMPGFQTEYLCQWVDAMEPGVIPAEQWYGGMNSESEPAEGAVVYAALDVNYDRSHAYVAIAARRGDGNLHIEVIESAPGTDWVVPWLAQRKKQFKGVAVQKSGAPVSGMIQDLVDAGVPVVEWGPGTALTAGCGLFYDKIVQGEVYHRPSLVLDRAAASTIARRVNDAWIFDRRNSPVDAAPLVACAAAVWLSENCPKPGNPEVHLWPDDAEIEQWNQEADEMAKEWAEEEKENDERREHPGR
jgi:hypothetical protein